MKIYLSSNRESLYGRKILMMPLLFVCVANLRPASAAQAALEQHQTVLGALNSPVQVIQTPQGPRNFVIRDVDEVRSETVNGCHLAFATTNDPQSPKLHVMIDGQIVPGYDDVAWHSLGFSPDGKHVAFIANVDGKQVCVLDGKPGPKFDQIGSMGTDFGTALVFSPDSQHLGYAAKSGNKWCVVVDGVPGPESDDVEGIFATIHMNRDVNGLPRFAEEEYGGASALIFTPDSKHYFYLASRMEGKKRLYAMVFDGKPGPEFDQCAGADISPDGRHVAFAGSRNSVAQVIYDGVPGKPLPGQAGGVVFSRDSQHMAYVCGVYAKAQQVVVDGVPGPMFDGIDEDGVSFSPDSKHVLYNAFLNENLERTILDGKVVDSIDGNEVKQVEFSFYGSHVIYTVANNKEDEYVVDGKVVWKLPQNSSPTISPDGQHIAYAVSISNGEKQIMLDGAAGPLIDHPGTLTLKFSADSRHLACVFQNQNKIFQVILDGKMGPAFDSIAKDPFFSSDDSHFAYAAKKGELWEVVVDGNVGPDLYNVDLDTMQFSADGGKLVYTALIGYQQTVVLNTTPGPKYDEIRKGSLAFSPDGKHFAYVAKTENGKWLAVVDGAAGPEFDQIGDKNVLFSSDGKHSAYVAQKSGKQELLTDGTPGPDFSNIVAGPVECKDGHLEYLAVATNEDKTNLVRVTVPGFGPAKP